MAYETISALRCHCEFCGHQWITEVLPERCAKCKRRTWNRVRGVELGGHGGRDGSGSNEQVPAPGRRDPARKVPFGVAFDGENIWVANWGNTSNSVTKFRANDGSAIGTFAVGSQPSGIAFDGANIWVANWGANSVTKLRASNGSNLGLRRSQHLGNKFQRPERDEAAGE